MNVYLNAALQELEEDASTYEKEYFAYSHHDVIWPYFERPPDDLVENLEEDDTDQVYDLNQRVLSEEDDPEHVDVPPQQEDKGKEPTDEILLFVLHEQTIGRLHEAHFLISNLFAIGYPEEEYEGHKSTDRQICHNCHDSGDPAINILCSEISPVWESLELELEVESEACPVPEIVFVFWEHAHCESLPEWRSLIFETETFIRYIVTVLNHGDQSAEKWNGKEELCKEKELVFTCH